MLYRLAGSLTNLPFEAIKVGNQLQLATLHQKWEQRVTHAAAASAAVFTGVGDICLGLQQYSPVPLHACLAMRAAAVAELWPLASSIGVTRARQSAAHCPSPTLPTTHTDH